MFVPYLNFKTASWSEIQDNVKKGLGPIFYPIGSSREATMNGHKCTLIVVDHNRDANNSMTIWMTFDANNAIKSKWTTQTGSTYYNYENSNCLARTTIESWLGYFDGNSLPDYNNHLLLVSKAYCSIITERLASSTYTHTASYSTYNCKIFIPSATELNLINLAVHHSFSNSNEGDIFLLNSTTYNVFNKSPNDGTRGDNVANGGSGSPVYNGFYQGFSYSYARNVIPFPSTILKRPEISNSNYLHNSCWTRTPAVHKQLTRNGKKTIEAYNITDYMLTCVGENMGIEHNKNEEEYLFPCFVIG